MGMFEVRSWPELELHGFSTLQETRKLSFAFVFPLFRTGLCSRRSACTSPAPEKRITEISIFALYPRQRGDVELFVVSLFSENNNTRELDRDFRRRLLFSRRKARVRHN
jgi:hypothetical protein